MRDHRYMNNLAKMPRFRSERFSFPRYSEKCFTRIYRALYGDAMLVLIQIGTNICH